MSDPLDRKTTTPLHMERGRSRESFGCVYRISPVLLEPGPAVASQRIHWESNIRTAMSSPAVRKPGT